MLNNLIKQLDFKVELIKKFLSFFLEISDEMYLFNKIKTVKHDI